MESWDDDLDLQGNIFANPHSTVKTSASSRLSIRSESESNAGEEDWQVPLTSNDQQSASNAISSAKQAGIPLPNNVPPSALVGGSIKKLGTKKSRKNLNNNEDWGDDLEIPDAGPDKLKLKLESRKDVTPNVNEQDELDEWAEGSLGIRTAGTRREAKNRTPSTLLMSPSIGSCMTFESEEDGMDGLVLPTGPVDFEAALRKRKDQDDRGGDIPREKYESKVSVQHVQKNLEEDMDDLDFGPGDVFDPRKRALNRNVKPNWKPTNNGSSPASKAHTTLTFSDKPTSTKLPRPISSTKPSTRLEPVFETGAANVNRQRRHEATTTSAQLLRSKRSMPVLHSQRNAATRQPPVPFLPSSNSQQSQIRQTRSTHFHSRHNSDPNRSGSPIQRPPSRTPGQTPDTPTKPRKDLAPSYLAREAASKRTVTRPAKRRNFGDGSELEMFDDLPTSATKESKFVKQPATRPQSGAMRRQASQSRLGSRDKMLTPLPSSAATSRSPTKADVLPRFARDTAASRIAREQTLGGPSHKRSETSLTTKTNWAAQVAARTPHSSPSAHRQAKKGPQLINAMGKENNTRHFQDDAAKKGMQWNSALSRWEGNDAILHAFEPSVQQINSAAPPSPPRPALITNMAGAGQGVQVVGGMVFDPARMCWLKLGRRESQFPLAASNDSQSNPMSPSGGDEEDDDDPFKGIDDLKENEAGARAGVGKDSSTNGGGVGGDWLVGEEFDLGPEFIKRQREEEAVWRGKCAGWFVEGAGGDVNGHARDEWLWKIRDLAEGRMQT